MKTLKKAYLMKVIGVFLAEIKKTRYHFLHCSPYDLECLFNPVVSIGHSSALFGYFVYSGVYW